MMPPGPCSSTGSNAPSRTGRNGAAEAGFSAMRVGIGISSQWLFLLSGYNTVPPHLIVKWTLPRMDATKVRQPAPMGLYARHVLPRIENARHHRHDLPVAVLRRQPRLGRAGHSACVLSRIGEARE